MRLRTARKIVKAIGTPRQTAYSSAQLERALSRVERTKDARIADQFWDALMVELGPMGRAEVLEGSGAPAMAFSLLMDTPEDKWTYGPTMFAKTEAEP